MTSDPGQAEQTYGYQRIFDSLRELITSGTLDLGDRLATQAQLCEQYGVSRGVVRQALRLLENEGLIDGGRGGRATVIRKPPKDLAAIRHELVDLHETALDLATRIQHVLDQLNS